MVIALIQPIQFKRAFKKLFNMKLLEHSETQNCANYNDDLLNIIGTLNTIETFTISELVCQRIKLKNFCT